MSVRADVLLNKALQALDPDERDELLHGLLLGRLGASVSTTGLLGRAAGLSVDRERLSAVLGPDCDAASTAGVQLKVLPIRLPEADYERLREFCHASGFSMAVVIRALVERFLDQQAPMGETA